MSFGSVTSRSSRVGGVSAGAASTAAAAPTVDSLDSDECVSVFVLVSVCVVSLSVRVCNTVLLQTFFSPDEYWQALEPAHVAVFGYGALTWEWTAMIRSFIHPLIYAIPYQLLRLFSLDHTFLRVNIYASLFLDTSYLHFTSLLLLFADPGAEASECPFRHSVRPFDLSPGLHFLWTWPRTLDGFLPPLISTHIYLDAEISLLSYCSSCAPCFHGSIFTA